MHIFVILQKIANSLVANQLWRGCFCVFTAQEWRFTQLRIRISLHKIVDRFPTVILLHPQNTTASKLLLNDNENRILATDKLLIMIKKDTHVQKHKPFRCQGNFVWDPTAGETWGHVLRNRSQVQQVFVATELNSNWTRRWRHPADGGKLPE